MKIDYIIYIFTKKVALRNKLKNLCLLRVREVNKRRTFATG